MRIVELLNEKVIPKTKPVDYQIVVDGNSVGTKPFKIGNTYVSVDFSIGPQSVSSRFLKLLIPKFILGNKINAGDLAFITGADPESMTDQKNTGKANPDASKILRSVAYIANDIVYQKRSILPFITFLARPGENRDTIYERLATEFTASWNNWGYSRLSPGAVLGVTLSYSMWMWAHRSVFNNWSGNQTEIRNYLFT